MDKFYLVRSSDTYTRTPIDTTLQGRTSDIEVAKSNALALATKNRTVYFVYEVTPVGRAEVSEAVWKGIEPEKDEELSA